MEKQVTINYVGGREAVLERVRRMTNIRSIPKEKIWDSITRIKKRAPHPYALGCECPSCENILYRMMEASRD